MPKNSWQQLRTMVTVHTWYNLVTRNLTEVAFTLQSQEQASSNTLGTLGQAGFSGHVVNFGHGGHAGSGGHSGSEINAHDIYSGPTGTHCRERNGSSGNAENCGNGVQSDRAVTDDSDNSPTYDSNSGVNFNGTKIHGSNQNTPSNGTPYYQQQGLVLGIPQSQSLTHPAMPSYPGLMEYSCPSAGIYQQLEGVYLPGYYTVSPQVGVQQTQQGQQQGQQQQGRQQQASPVFIHDNHPSKFVRQKPIQFLHSFNGQVMLAVFVLICFLGAFGLVALILAGWFQQTIQA